MPVSDRYTEGEAVEAAPDVGESDVDETADLKARVVELEDLWRRALADIDNLRKRVARDMQNVRGDERARVAADFLPVLDNLELALAHARSDPEAIVQGIQAVRDQAVAVLERLGFPRRDDVGEKFDPVRHQAVSAVEDTDAEPGTVVHVVRPGYGEDEHQLRPAAVVVAQRPD